MDIFKESRDEQTFAERLEQKVKIRKDGKAYGLEIESLIRNGLTRDDAARIVSSAGIECHDEYYNHVTKNYWKLVHDSSIQGSGMDCEIVSPILHNGAGFSALKTVLDVIKNQCGGNVNTSTGLHVHINTKRMRTRDVRKSGVARRKLIINEVVNILALYSQYETVIDYFLPESRRDNFFAKSVRPYMEQVARDYNDTGRDVDSINDIYKYFNNGRGYNRDYPDERQRRYFKVNIECYVRYGSVEFRQHHGTLEYDKICYWVELLQAICKKAYDFTLTGILLDGRLSKTKETMLGELREYLSPATIKYFKKRYNDNVTRMGGRAWN